MVDIQVLLTSGIEASVLFGVALVGYGIVRTAIKRVGCKVADTDVVSPSGSGSGSDSDVVSDWTEAEQAAYEAASSEVEQEPELPEQVSVDPVEVVPCVLRADWCEHTDEDRALVESMMVRSEPVVVVTYEVVAFTRPVQEERGSGRKTIEWVDSLSAKEWTRLLTIVGVHAAGKMGLARRRKEMIKRFVEAELKEAALV